MAEPDRSTVRRLAAESIARGDATGWFEMLYQSAEGNAGAIPWADGVVNPNLARWLESRPLSELGPRTLVVGCGLGDDAEELATLGQKVTAFDVSHSAIAWCRRRFPDSKVDYQAADLLDPPPSWQSAFSFIFEAYTLQTLPPEPRRVATQKLAELLAPGGTLLVLARARNADEPAGNMPWPLTREDLQPLVDAGLEVTSFEDYHDDEDPPVRRFRVTYRRPA